MSTASDAAKNAYSSALATLNKTESAYEQANTDYLNMLDQSTDGDDTGKYVSINQAGNKKVGQYTAKTTIPYIGAQYILPYNDGYLGTEIGSDGLCFVRFDGSLKPLDYMTVKNGGHGGSFGLDGSGNIWSDTLASNGGYQISKFSYQAGKTIDAHNLTALATFPDLIRVNYDQSCNMLGYTRGTKYYVCDPGDIDNPKYSIDLTAIGYDVGSQTWQSQSLSLPYLWWHTGSYSTADPATLGCVNVETNTLQFVKTYDTSAFNMSYPLSEAETVFASGSVIYVGFNNHDSSTAVTYLFTLPVVNASKDLQKYLDTLNAAKSALAKAKSAFNSAKSDYQKYQSTGKSVVKDTCEYKNATKDVKSQEKLVASTKKKIAIVTKQYAKATGTKKQALKNQLDALNKVLKEQSGALTKLKKRAKTAKNKLASVKKKQLTAQKNAERKMLKQEISANITTELAQFGGNKDVVIQPVNPGSKDSYVIIFADEEDITPTATVNSYPVIKGQPLNTITSYGTTQITITGHIQGKPNSLESIKKRWTKLQRWCENMIEVEYSGSVSNTHCLVETATQTHDKDYNNVIPVTVTLDYVNWADSNIKKKKKKTSSGKKNKTAGAGHKKSSKKYITVKAGDTYWKVAQKYNVSVSQLEKWNGWPATKIPVGKKMRYK